MRGGPAQREHGGGLRAAEDLAVALAGLEEPERHDGQAAAQPVKWHAHVAFDESRNAEENAHTAPLREGCSWPPFFPVFLFFFLRKVMLTETAQGHNASMQNLGKGASS